jgi:hypothetical protein
MPICCAMMDGSVLVSLSVVGIGGSMDRAWPQHVVILLLVVVGPRAGNDMQVGFIARGKEKKEWRNRWVRFPPFSLVQIQNRFDDRRMRRCSDRYCFDHSKTAAARTVHFVIVVDLRYCWLANNGEEKGCTNESTLFDCT